MTYHAPSGEAVHQGMNKQSESHHRHRQRHQRPHYHLQSNAGPLPHDSAKPASKFPTLSLSRLASSSSESTRGIQCSLPQVCPSGNLVAGQLSILITLLGSVASTSCCLLRILCLTPLCKLFE
eukprot:UN1279